MNHIRDFVFQKFEGKYRKSERGETKLPYAYHCLAVETMVWKWGAGNYERRAAALCHDLYEDTNTTYEELCKVAGENVAMICKELTFIPEQGITKENYLASFKYKSVNACVVKFADRFCNVLDFLVVDPAYAKEYYHKADALLALMHSRFDEFVNELGATVVDQMFTTRRMVQMMLGYDAPIVI